MGDESAGTDDNLVAGVEPELQRTTTYSEYERAAIERVLSAVEKRADKYTEQGMSASHFFIGVVNALLVCAMWFGYPQYMWILYLVEAAVLFPLRFYYQWIAKPMRQSYFWFDLCWVANFAAGSFLLIILLDKVTRLKVSDGWRESLFCMAWTIGTGPLAGACGALGNALIFHSPNHWASLFIHFFPTLVLYTMRHESAVVKAAFPNLLSLDYFGHVSALTLFLHFAAFYGTWLATFTVWMVVDGLKLPKRGYDTIFHQNMRDTPFLMKLKYEEEERKRRAKENEWKASDVLLYLACHACACFLSVAVISIPCFFYKPFHMFVIAALAVCAVWNGASAYNYFLLQSYKKVIRSELKNLEKRD